ncbi:XRE family transcriptional regulator [Clostridium sporogenes]|uniref:Helix-turn-helix family protein n=1 Tax=Clostridium sporogenes TaxID=1509 RepID=A0A1L3NFW5_CLOSG|nr:helix-turn-helix transcriptional regulator [Clostridium sporogenes]APH15014.1 helix-turn-helix family protein [Clostridium sporogenes]
MNYGAKIKLERKKKGLTQKQLAKQLGKSESIIRKYESGNVIPSIEMYEKIANILDVPIDKIMVLPEQEKTEIDSFEIIYDFIEKYFNLYNQQHLIEKIPFPEQMELALNIKNILHNKIEKLTEFIEQN